MKVSYSTPPAAGVLSRDTWRLRMGAGALAMSAAIGVLAFAAAAHAEQASMPSGEVANPPVAQPADSSVIELAQTTPPAAPGASAAAPTATPAPAGDYTVDAVDQKLGSNPLMRFFRYYGAEWGHDGAPVDPKAPPTIRDGWPVVPQSTPPMPFTDWPYGGTTLIGDNRTGSVDSPLMVALSHTPIGDFVAKTGIQLYGWIDYGGHTSRRDLKVGKR